MESVQREDVEVWSSEERARVARLLDEFVERPTANRPVKLRMLVVVSAFAGAAVLIPWIGYISMSLPETYSVHAWDVVWTGFDVALAVCLGLAGWLVLRRRQVAMFGLIVAATLLLCDTWFDVCLAWNTSDQTAALLSAVVQVSLAAVLAGSALRIFRRTARITRQLRGQVDGPDSIWQQRFMMLPPNP